jgi:hypothetical protein
VGMGSQLVWLGLADALGNAVREPGSPSLRRGERLRSLLGSVALGAGLAGPLSGAALAGLFGGSAPFVRTPKSGDLPESGAAALGPSRDPEPHAEQRPEVQAPEASPSARGRARLQPLPLLLGLWQLAGALTLLQRGAWPWAVWFLPGIAGGLWVGLHDPWEAFSRSRSRRTRARSSGPLESPSAPPRPRAPRPAPRR